MAEARTIRGTIAQANDGGIKLDDDERWFNYGQRYTGPKQFSRGQQAQIEYVDWQKPSGGELKFYVNSVRVLDGASPSGTPKNGDAALPPNSREVLIMRESVLKTAAEFLRLRYEARGDVPSLPPPVLEDLLLTADALETWCMADRSKEPDLDEPPPLEEPPPEDSP
jgi:hypothetical protein